MDDGTIRTRGRNGFETQTTVIPGGPVETTEHKYSVICYTECTLLVDIKRTHCIMKTFQRNLVSKVSNIYHIVV